MTEIWTYWLMMELELILGSITSLSMKWWSVGKSIEEFVHSPSKETITWLYDAFVDRRQDECRSGAIACCGDAVS